MHQKRVNVAKGQLGGYSSDAIAGPGCHAVRDKGEGGHSSDAIAGPGCHAVRDTSL